MSPRNRLGDAVVDYGVLPPRQARLLAPALPIVELALAVLCVAGVALPLTAGAIALLLLAFTAAIVANLAQGRHVRCHCFGDTGTVIGPAVLVRNVALLAVAAAIALTALSRGEVVSATWWKTDVQILTHLDTAAPLVAVAALALAMVALLNEMGVVFDHARMHTRRD